MSDKTVLVTGANGFIGNAVAKAFRRAGWKTFGLIRRSSAAPDLAEHEIRPVIGAPSDLSFLEQLGREVFDVVVSNTEAVQDPFTHFEEVGTMLSTIAEGSQRAGKRPLMMFTSGCKDYGKMTELNGDAGLAPHTEASPMNPPSVLRARMNFGGLLLQAGNALYDATVLRPTIVYGRSSSLYGQLFDLASRSESVLQFQAHPNAIMHSLHVDDCAEAYVALAEHPRRNDVGGQAFNLSNARYETAQEVGEALAQSYGLTLSFVDPTEEFSLGNVQALANFSQWVGSDKVRALTGWGERKPMFAAGCEEYRMAFEARQQALLH